jgi:hypothetical protein
MLLITEDDEMAARDSTKIITKVAATEEPAEDKLGQRKRPEPGRFRLQVDRQTKSSYATYEAAENAGLGIKQGYPLVQVTVYDALEGANKIIELPQS